MSAENVFSFWDYRLCLAETSCPQEDNYPNSLCIKVNGKLFPLPVSLFACVCGFFDLSVVSVMIAC